MTHDEAVDLALADIGLPGGRSGFALLQELGGSGGIDPQVSPAFRAADMPDWFGPALDMGGLKPPRKTDAHPRTASRAR